MARALLTIRDGESDDLAIAQWLTRKRRLTRRWAHEPARLQLLPTLLPAGAALLVGRRARCTGFPSGEGDALVMSFLASS